MQLVGAQQSTGDDMHTGHRRSRAEKEGKQHRPEQSDQPLQVLQAQIVSRLQRNCSQAQSGALPAEGSNSKQEARASRRE